MEPDLSRPRGGVLPRVAGPNDPTREVPPLDASRLQNPHFSTTDWTVILEVANLSPAVAHEALARICERYWAPVYAFYRRHGNDPEQAQDLTQGLFLALLESSSLRNVSPENGRFRSFLLGAAKHHQAGELRRLLAKKRGGGVQPLSLNIEREEGHPAFVAVEKMTPEKLYERRWAFTLIEHAMVGMEKDADEQGSGEVFRKLKTYLTGCDAAPYSEVAAELDMTIGAVKVAVHRLRKKFAKCLRAEVSRTLQDPSDLEDELSFLFSVFDS